jgi:hypothetical protein
LGGRDIKISAHTRTGHATTMKAIVQDKYGSPEVLKLQKVDKPRVGLDDVLVRVCAAGVHIGDWHLMSGEPDLMRVVGFGLSLTFEQAAAVPTSAFTALQALRTGGVQSRQKVLIVGASGGVGMFAVQIALAQLRHTLVPRGTPCSSAAKGDRWLGIGRSLQALLVSPFVSVRWLRANRSRPQHSIRTSTMNNNLQPTLHERDGPRSYRKTATTIGVIYLLGMVVGIGGNVLILSILGASDPVAAVGTSEMLLAIGAMLWLLAAAGDAAHGILMFPVLKPFSERIALGYFGARIIDAVFVGIMALLILFQIPLANEYLKAGASDTLQSLSTVLNQAQLYAYHFGMVTVGFAGLMLCYVFYKTRLVPRFLGVWGLVGYAIILGGSVLEIMGFNLNSIHAIPGGLWEVFIGVWLIVKGFSVSPVRSEGTTPSTTPIVPAPALGGATA